jgi:hypothetical protein
VYAKQKVVTVKLKIAAVVLTDQYLTRSGSMVNLGVSIGELKLKNPVIAASGPSASAGKWKNTMTCLILGVLVPKV